MKIKPFPKVENIHAIPIPLPMRSDLITANLYVLGSGPLTLIDSGPKFPGLMEHIQKELEMIGFSISDIEKVYLTHGHLDHFGMVASIREEAGHPVECYIHPADEWQISGEDYHEDMWSEESGEFVAMVDLPLEELEKVKMYFSTYKYLCDPVADAILINDGDELTGNGYHLKVIHTPGHSPGAVCFYEAREKVLFSGDSVISHITPNPLMEMRRGPLRDPNYKSLKVYLNSIDRLSKLDVRYVFPGHGEYMDDLPSKIASYYLHHRERMELIWKALRRKPRPIYHIIDEVFPFVPEGDVFLAISEIIVHLEMLIEEGRAELSDPGPPAIFRAL